MDLSQALDRSPTSAARPVAGRRFPAVVLEALASATRPGAFRSRRAGRRLPPLDRGRAPRWGVPRPPAFSLSATVATARRSNRRRAPRGVRAGTTTHNAFALRSSLAIGPATVASSRRSIVAGRHVEWAPARRPRRATCFDADFTAGERAASSRVLAVDERDNRSPAVATRPPLDRRRARHIDCAPDGDPRRAALSRRRTSVAASAPRPSAFSGRTDTAIDPRRSPPPPRDRRRRHADARRDGTPRHATLSRRGLRRRARRALRHCPARRSIVAGRQRRVRAGTATDEM